MEDFFEKDEVINFAQNPKYSLRNRALIAFLFLTGARVGEVVRSIKKSQIKIEIINKKEWFIIYHVVTEKRKPRFLRNIPIDIEREKQLVDIVLKYLEWLKDDEFVFGINRKRAFGICKLVTGKGPHFLRHSRLTNLRREYGWDGFALQVFTGWADLKSADPYVHLNWLDLIQSPKPSPRLS